MQLLVINHTYYGSPFYPTIFMEIKVTFDKGKTMDALAN